MFVRMGSSGGRGKQLWKKGLVGHRGGEGMG